MANVIIDNSNLTNIAEAIRSKNGTETTYKPSEMSQAIRNIQTYKPEETFNVTPTTSAQTVTPSEGHVFSSGTVQAMPTGSILVNTPTIDTSTGVVTASTTLSTAGYIGTNPSSNTLSLDTQAATTITPTTSEQTAVAANKYTIGEVKVAAMPTGTVGTATATKGTVSNNLISVTPNVAAGTAGYNAMAAYSGDAVTVSASELVSGTVTTTPKITSQSVDVTNYATSTVGPIYEEISTSAAMDAVNVDANIGKMYKYTGTTDTKYTNGRLYVVEDNTYYGLTFTANTAGSTVAMSVTGTPTLGQNFSYSTDNITWSIFTPGTTTITLTNAGDKVYFKGNNPNGVNEYDEETMTGTTVYKFIFTGSIAASGNIMSLIDNGSCNILTIPNAGCFCNMFQGCTALTAAPELPATTLTEGCYYEMFDGCTSLTTAPALPATTLADCCYDSMFLDCTSLQVNDSSVSGAAEQTWRIPTSGTFTNTYAQSDMFTECAGTRSSNDMAGAAGSSYTYYTQNTPV